MGSELRFGCGEVLGAVPSYVEGEYTTRGGTGGGGV